MSQRTTLAAAAALACFLIGCLDEDESVGESESELSSVYTPFTGSSSSGSASLYDWHGYRTSYPAANEDFRAYSSSTTVECASTKSSRSHIDVTAGCLTAISSGGSVRGKIKPTVTARFAWSRCRSRAARRGR